MAFKNGEAHVIRTALGAFALAFALSLGVAGEGCAQDYPSRPITLIVPFAAGGTSDVIARIAAEAMGQALGQRFVVENVAGAGGTIALARAAKAEPDGYTVLVGNAGTNAAAYWIYPNLTYKPEAFAPVGMIAKTLPVLAVSKEFPAQTLAQFLALAKAKPDDIRLGHAGVGSSNYLICKSFIHATGAKVTLVSYRGASPALNDLMGGHVDGVCDTATSLSNALETGQARGLAVAASARVPSLPNIPTAAEAGAPEFLQEGWNAVFVPKGTQQTVIEKLNKALRQAVASDLVQTRLKELSAKAASDEEMNPGHVAKLVPAEIARYKTLLVE